MYNYHGGLCVYMTNNVHITGALMALRCWQRLKSTSIKIKYFIFRFSPYCDNRMKHFRRLDTTSRHILDNGVSIYILYNTLARIR